jgi:hypothetical protein
VCSSALPSSRSSRSRNTPTILCGSSYVPLWPVRRVGNLTALSRLFLTCGVFTGFDQALEGTDLVRDSATGQTFEAPYSAYRASGPDGPGYYTGSPGNLKKLQILTP